MTQSEQQTVAKTFSENWSGKGDEKQDSQRYWIGILGDVLGIASPQNYIQFEKRVKLSHTSFIDAYIPETKVLIEQKGIKIDLNKAYEQSDGTVLTPYQQAKRYSDELPLNLKPRWIVVSNFAEIHVHDMNKPDDPPEVIFLKDLEKDFYRLEFLVDRKNENIRREVDISVAAGALVGKMYDALVKEYINPTAESYRSLNILCVRLVFCFYAEDAGLFETRTSFEDYIKSFAIENLRDGMIKLFKALDTEKESRDKYDLKLKPFPYVNGGLFHDENIEIPNFTQEIVGVLVNDCAPFNWAEISPTIFGAVFESTLNPETRRKGGMHYTSIENIHKVIDPLFLDRLNAEFDGIIGGDASSRRGNGFSDARTRQLLNFQEKLGSLTFLDPACGSGNFLTETYISLRRLENKVISALNKGEKVLGFDEFIKVKISQFYGIEINDFAVTVAKTALWIAESQMINETEKIISQQIDFLPLQDHANIVEGNALRMDWAFLGKRIEDLGMSHLHGFSLFSDENADSSLLAPISYDFIIGNPPFSGARIMDKDGHQKEDIADTFKDIKGAGNLDYVCCWYKKAAEYMRGKKTRAALVSTNSITQGEQVPVFWKVIFGLGIQIDFAYRTFRWYSESSDMAHVHCVIVGFSLGNRNSLLSSNSSLLNSKFIITESGEKIPAAHINGYLLDLPDIFIESRKKPICNVKEMVFGSMANDGRNLLIEENEYENFVKHDPQSEKYIKQFLGSEEFINNKKRYCLWLVDAKPGEMRKMPLVSERVGAVKKLRESSTREATRKLADTSWLFGEIRQPRSGNYLLIPRVSSENRRYIPIGFISSDIIASDATLIIPNADLYDFGILTSSVHMAWMRAVCGRLKSDYRYSAQIVYNNFPWPGASAGKRNEKSENSKLAPNSSFLTSIEQTAQAILDARTKYPESSFADLYDEKFMPADLRKAHEANDRAAMQAYGFDTKMTEAEIVAELFRMYATIVKVGRETEMPEI